MVYCQCFADEQGVNLCLVTVKSVNFQVVLQQLTNSVPDVLRSLNLFLHFEIPDLKPTVALIPNLVPHEMVLL